MVSIWYDFSQFRLILHTIFKAEKCYLLMSATKNVGHVVVYNLIYVHGFFYQGPPGPPGPPGPQVSHS